MKQNSVQYYIKKDNTKNWLVLMLYKNRIVTGATHFQNLGVVFITSPGLMASELSGSGGE